MSHLFLTLLLAPILIIQGKYVRKVTPKLPEAKGKRVYNDKQQGATKVLIVGDSAAAGVGVSDQADALLGQIKQAFNTEEVNLTLMASTGSTTKDTLAQLTTVANEPYDLIVISLGVNDVTRNISRQAFIEKQQALFELLKQKFSPRLIISTSIPPMHQFPALPNPLRWFVGRRAKILNQDLYDLSQNHTNVYFLRLSLPEDPSLIATDGFHPGPAVYNNWAQACYERYKAL